MFLVIQLLLKDVLEGGMGVCGCLSLVACDEVPKSFLACFR